MHLLFVHRNFPAQFGHIAAHLVEHEGFRSTFVSELPPGVERGIERVQYKPSGGATAATHFCSRTFENGVWHAHAVYEVLKARPDIRPDLIVGHSGFGSTLFLPELYDCPIVNYFEYYYRAHDCDMDFRPEFRTGELETLRAHSRNAMILLDLEACQAGYCPTEWQQSLFPQAYQAKLETIFDGIDTDLWRRREVPRRVGDREIPPDTRIVTYVSRGFESMRGFDVFMRVAKRIYQARPDVVFICVGSDRVCYGGDMKYIQASSFKEHVLAQDEYDLDRFVFTGNVPTSTLADLLSISDLHLYFTVPFVLSWSLMNALACECTVVASGTAPVVEMIEHEQNGLLADFHDEDRLVELALTVLDDPPVYRRLGQAARQRIEERYSLAVSLPRMLDLYRRAAGG